MSHYWLLIPTKLDIWKGIKQKSNIALWTGPETLTLVIKLPKTCMQVRRCEKMWKYWYIHRIDWYHYYCQRLNCKIIYSGLGAMLMVLDKLLFCNLKTLSRTEISVWSCMSMCLITSHEYYLVQPLINQAEIFYPMSTLLWVLNWERNMIDIKEFKVWVCETCNLIRETVKES